MCSWYDFNFSIIRFSDCNFIIVDLTNTERFGLQENFCNEDPFVLKHLDAAIMKIAYNETTVGEVQTACDDAIYTIWRDPDVKLMDLDRFSLKHLFHIGNGLGNFSFSSYHIHFAKFFYKICASSWKE